MELKVWVDNIQRIVCGVSDATTCQDVVYALAHATSQTGRFTLVEKWRNNERILSPADRPLQVLLKWGEYSGDVHFVLKRSTANATQQLIENKDHKVTPLFSPQHSLNTSTDSANYKDIKKSLTFSGGHSHSNSSSDLLNSSCAVQSGRCDVNDDKTIGGANVHKLTHTHKKPASIRVEPDGVLARGHRKIGPPPEYRVPPPRQQSPINVGEYVNGRVNNKKCHKMDVNAKDGEYVVNSHTNNNVRPPEPPQRTQASQDASRYLELLRIVNTQRQQISTFDCQLSKYDSEIKTLEENNKKDEEQAEALLNEINRLELSEKGQSQLIEQLQENELMEQLKQSEQEQCYLKQQIEHIKTECKNKDEESKALAQKAEQMAVNVQHLQVTELNNEIKQSINEFDMNAEQCKHDERQLNECNDQLQAKHDQVNDLVEHIKAVNLQSLTLASSDDTKTDGSSHTRSGSARKIKGSPRELENAVPTSNNPHGVWV